MIGSVQQTDAYVPHEDVINVSVSTADTDVTKCYTPIPTDPLDRSSPARRTARGWRRKRNPEGPEKEVCKVLTHTDVSQKNGVHCHSENLRFRDC